MVSGMKRSLRLSTGIGLVSLAAGLWLSGATAGHASSSTQDQSVSLSVASSISWGASGCTNSLANSGTIGTNVAAGTSNVTSSEYTGCVSSNAPWSIAAQIPSSLTNGSDTIPNANVKVEAVATDLPVGSITTCTVLLPCALGSQQTVLTGALLTGSSFGIKYHVDVPSTALAGTYSGTVRWTASN